MVSRKENKRSQRRVSTSQIDEENEKWLEKFIKSPSPTQNRMKKFIKKLIPINNPSYFPIQGA